MEDQFKDRSDVWEALIEWMLIKLSRLAAVDEQEIFVDHLIQFDDWKEKICTLGKLFKEFLLFKKKVKED